MIVQYFESTCRILIAEFNSLTHALSPNEKEIFAVNKMSEFDIVSRLGKPFGHLVRYEKSPDLLVDELNLRVEVKYWRYWLSEGRKHKHPLPWKYTQKDLDWLMAEICRGHKGHSCFIVGWSPVLEWRSLVPLSEKGHRSAPINRERFAYLPFLSASSPDRIDSVHTDYGTPEGAFAVQHQSTSVEIDWRLFGKGDDFLNLAIYW